MSANTKPCKPGYVYHLVANTDGMYPRSTYMTDKYQLWIEEKRQLIEYALEHGCLPPGNKLFK